MEMANKLIQSDQIMLAPDQGRYILRGIFRGIIIFCYNKKSL